MVPWPIAILSLFYAAVATCSGVAVWRAATGASTQALLWPAVWLAISGGITVGLPLLKPWARPLAVVGSVLLMVTTLAIATLLVRAGRPVGGLATALSAGVHMVAIRYLQRPSVTAYFNQ